jgi:transketolase
MDNSVIKKAANNIRILSAAMVEKAQSGHPGGAMGGAEFINILYSEFLRFDPSDTEWKNRDRFFLDPGHMSAMLYSTLSLYGFFSMDELSNFRQWGSPTPGHPEVDFSRGIENTSGPLGQGHTYAVGAAIAEKFLKNRFGNWMEHKIYSYISDGGVQEEISQGAGRLAGHLGLDNLIMFYDSNNIQLSSGTDEVTSENTAAKYKAWGWNVLEVDGTNPDEIREALKAANNQKGKPTLIVGKTVMGQGAITADGKTFEGQCSTHGQPLSHSGASFEKTIQNLGGDPANPFVIFPEVKQWLASVIETKKKEASIRKNVETQWRKDNPVLAGKWDLFFSGKIPSIDFNGIEIKADNATRAASASVLTILAQKVENMIVSSADLSNSDKTDGFLKKTTVFRKDDFSGAFLQAGVSEFTMAAVMIGMALHGGIIPACGTFFVFSDYIKPAARVAALMELPVKFIWTHDAFRVGEDGPTHQPVEHEAQIRLMEKLKNHSGKNSMLVLRPADSAETIIAWQMALENTDTPTALILSRQNIKDLPARNGSTRIKDALESKKGAYIVQDAVGKPDLVFIASGSEVATMIAGAELLRARKNLEIQVVSVISEGLFRTQPADYQKKVLPSGIPVLGFTAGLPVTLEGLAGPMGRVFGLGSFGFSAPAKVLDEKLGFTAENVVKEAEFLLVGK